MKNIVDIKKILRNRKGERLPKINIALTIDLNWFLKRRNVYIICISSLVLVGLIFASMSWLRGEVINIYPEICLGDWQNPQNSQGQPDANGKFNKNNSAVWQGGLTQIFCGDFKLGSLTEDKKGQEIKSAQLKISWKQKLTSEVQEEEQEIIIPESTPEIQFNTDQQQEETPKSGNQIQIEPNPIEIRETTPTPQIEPAPTLEPTPASTPEPTPEITPEQTPAPEPTPSPESSPSPEASKQSPNNKISRTNKFLSLLNFVFAQENNPEQSPLPEPTQTPPPSPEASEGQAAPEPTQTPTPEPTPESTPEATPQTTPEPTPDIPTLTPETIQEETIIAPPEVQEILDDLKKVSPESELIITTSTSTAEIGETTSAETTITQTFSNEIIEISYAIDGVSWNVLANLTPEGIKQNQVFELPGIRALDHVANLKIKIQGLSSDIANTVFLDALELNVEFDKPGIFEDKEYLEKLPRVQTEKEKFFLQKGNNFRADETPVFEINPELIGEEQPPLIEVEPQSVSEFQPETNPPQVETPAASPEPTPESTPEATPLPSPETTPTPEPTPTPTPTPTPSPEPSPSPSSSPEPTPESSPTSYKNSPSKISQTTNLTRFNLIRFLTRLNLVNAAKPDAKVLKAEVFNLNNNLTDIKPIIEETATGKLIIRLPKFRQFRPGRYILKVELKKGNLVYATTQDFTWGVLVLNPYKSIYLQGEKAKIGFGVLDDYGSTICDAKLDLQIILPISSSTKYNFSTTDGSIKYSDSCGPNNVTDEPDYYMFFDKTNEIGDYTLLLSAETANGLRSLTDRLVVQESVPFDVERQGSMRIYPPAYYTMKLKIKANENYSGEIKEIVPESFNILEVEPPKIIGDEQILQWQVNFQKGQTYTLSYTYDAPDISPEIFLLGPLQIGSPSTSGWQESREWQIASDQTEGILLFEDTGDATPSGWTCKSCASEGDTTYSDKFLVGTSTTAVGSTGGNTTTGHTVTVTVDTYSTDDSNRGGSTPPTVCSSHSHSNSTTVNATSTLPPFRGLKVIKRTSGTGIPVNAIAMFTSDPGAGWTVYTSQDGYFISGSSTATAGGSASHSHTIDTSFTGVTGTCNLKFGTGGGVDNTHTHTVASWNSSSTNNLPPYRSVTLYKKTGLPSVTDPTNMIVMFDAAPSVGWTVLSNAAGDFDNKFLTASSTAGNTGGTYSHSHTNATRISSQTSDTKGGTTNATVNNAHTHTVTYSSFSDTGHLPPYVGVVIAQKAVTSEITATIDSETKDLGFIIPGGSYISATSSISVVASGFTDYDLRAYTTNTTGTLYHTVTKEVKMPDFATSTTGLEPLWRWWNSTTSTSTNPGLNFSFRVQCFGTTNNYDGGWWGASGLADPGCVVGANSDDDGVAGYAGFPTDDSSATSTILDCTDAICGTGNTTTTIKWRLNATTTQRVGNYTSGGNIIFTVFANTLIFFFFRKKKTLRGSTS